MAVTTRQGKRGPSYRVTVDFPPDPITGQRRQRTETFRTKKEALCREREWLTEIERGTAVEASKLTVSDRVALWLDVLGGTNPKPRTVSEYERIISKHIIPHIGTTHIRRVTPATVDALRGEGASEDKYIGPTSAYGRCSTTRRSGASSP
jgi:hypothetical protein